MVTLSPGTQALVTGGTSGIGLAISEALAEAGADVVATGAKPEELDAASARLRGRAVRLAVLDVRDESAVGRLVDGLARIDVLVTCAGSGHGQGAEFEASKFIDTVDVNLFGTMRAAYAARPKLAAARGAIVTISSMYGFFGSAVTPGYAASKGGVAQLTRSLAVAWAAEGIRVNGVAPGWIETRLSAQARANPARSAAIVARTPMARWGQPEEVAGAVLFLCSAAAGFITGVILPVDGGYSAA